MTTGERMVAGAIKAPKLVAAVMVVAVVVLGVLAALPSVWPEAFPFLEGVKVDTDPENMLSEGEPVRVFHDRMKEVLDLSDLVVVGVVNEEHPQGVFNVETLANVYDLTQFALTLRGENLGKDDPQAGVIPADVIAPSQVDNIEQGGPGEVVFEWLMPEPPQTEEEALAVRDKAMNIPFLEGTMVSEDGMALAVYLPITSKDLSYEVYSALQKKIDGLKETGASEEYHVTGLPVAEDVFGVEMFIQMAVSAPLAMLVIFLLMLYFFRKIVLIISPMIVAMVCVIATMALLIITGNTIHIMSSMIPIFIMPIAVLDSIHILSEFFDRYQETKDREKTLNAVMRALFAPMLYTSLTSAAGFASLALTPIPPVQVFGVFVAFGILLAWLLTILFIPAYVMLLPPRMLDNFGATHSHDEEEAQTKTFLGRFLRGAGDFTFRYAKLVIAAAVILAVAAAYGIMQIQVNDNPTKWFRSSHPIRVADRVLNSHFGGTYMAYLALSPVGESPVEKAAHENGAQEVEDTSAAGDAEESSGGPSLPAGLGGDGESGESGEPGLPSGLGGSEEPGLPAGLGGEEVVLSSEVSEPEALEIFKHPAVLRYMADLQEHLLTTGVVGKSNSLTDIVKTVHRELIDGSEAAFRVPDSPAAVAQCLMQYQSSHRPQDLWHFVTQDYRTTSLWVQLTSGDNLDMQRVVQAVDEYFEKNPLEFSLDGEQVSLEPHWFGLTYINVVWQDKMVSGMRNAFLGSFLVVLLMMIVLFGSGLWALLSMIPLTLTIALIYGVIGYIGKDYDMPVAVLSSLTLGLAVDFAIHFLARSRAIHGEHGSWEAAYPKAFGEPARAIFRNIVVIAVGFLPLLAAPLVPYNTVGVFLASILLVSGVATLILLAALVRVLEPLLFPKTRACSITCRCGTCIVTAVVAVAVVWFNIVQFLEKGATAITYLSLVAVPVLMIACFLMSRRQRCQTGTEASE